MNINRVITLSLLSLFALHGPSLMAAKAVTKESCDVEAVCCETPKPGPFAYNYPYNAGLACPMNFFVHADALYWQAREGGLDFGVSTSTAPPFTAPVTNGFVAGFSGDNSDYSYNPGIRAGFTCFLSHDHWNVDLNVTWLHISDAKTRNAPAGGGIIPAWLYPQTFAAVGTPNLAWVSARGVWDSTVTVFDIDMGKPYQVSRLAAVNPYFGVRGAWIDQHFSMHYANALPGGVVHHGDNDFSGVGLRMGTRLCLNLGKGVDLYGNLAGSILYGKFDVDQSSTVAPLFDMNFDYKEVVPNLDVMLGLRWSAFIDDQKTKIALAIAYDFQEWWNQLQLRQWVGSSTGPQVQNIPAPRGDLSLAGWSFSLQFDL